MASESIGRDDELESIREFVEATPGDGPRALVLEGEAGIGKSTLWLEGLEMARGRGLRVLSSRPAEPERGFALASLGDLFEGVLDEVLPALAPPRRRALEVALLLEETQDPLAPRAVAVAVRSALELLAEAQPLLLAVDDVQWLDPSSTGALAFAVRRTGAAIHVLLARRVGAPSGFDSALPAQSVERLHVGPLSVGALQAVLRERLDRVFPRPTLLRIHETSGGNPFYALELARALPPELDPSGPLPVPKTLDGLLRARIDALPGSARQALVLLSALGEAETDTLRRAGAEGLLEAAVAHGVVVRAEERLRFAHPLLAASVYQHADGATRRSAHAALAAVVRDPLERARQLALAAEGPDAAVAASLDEAGSVASVRGLPRVAAELAEQARRLTPEDDADGRRRRRILAGLAHLRAGDLRRARTLGGAAMSEATDGRGRAEALVLMSGVEVAAGNEDRAIFLRRQALSYADAHPELQAAVHLWLGASLPDSEGVGVKERHTRASLELATRLGDDSLRAGALAMLAVLRFDAGEPDSLAVAEQAHALAASGRTRDERAHPSTELAHLLSFTYDRLDLAASTVLVAILKWVGRFDTARTLLDHLEQELAPGNEQLESKLLWTRCELEIHAGRWLLAQELAEREPDILGEHETFWRAPLVSAQLALHRGELDRARSLASASRREATGAIELRISIESEATLGLVLRAASDSAAALAHFAEAEATASACGWREPTILWWRADFAEALLEVGRVDDAVALLDAWEEDARRLGRNRILAHATRCRGLVAVARGDIQAALETLERAVDEADAETDPFGHARALLALGVTQRRAKRRSEARATLEQASAIFERLGAPLWVRKASAELARIGGRAPSRGELTPAERRVATLVAEGRTNREVAAALYLGERTVASHLTRIYAKLGVRTRTELAHRLR